MAATFKWSGAWTSRGNVLTTEMNSLADNGYSALGSAYDNSSNLDQVGALVLDLASLNPTTGAFVTVYMAQSLDGTNYENAPSSTNPGTHMICCPPITITTGSATKRAISNPFRLPPGKVKFAIRDDLNVAMAASGNTLALYTSNDGSV